MGCWVAALVGECARENYESLRNTGEFWVSSPRTPIRRAATGDSVLLYMAGEGFIGEAVVVSAARAPHDEMQWSGSTPKLGLPLRDLRLFAAPVTYKFPQKGPHPVLGFHRYALTGGFTSLSEEGLRDVLDLAAGKGHPEDEGLSEQAPSPAPVRKPAEPKVAEPAPAYEVRPARPVNEKSLFEKRVAGQHAKGEGRKRAALWTLAEMGAQTIGWKGGEKHARAKVRDAERTWIAGGTAEEKVGTMLEQLREHGFYIFHDVQLPGVGNVDHVALGPHGFFGIETKSQKGRVTAEGNRLLLNGRPPEKDFVSQAWRGCYRLKEILGSEVIPLLCFTQAFVEGRVFVKGVRVLPLRWMKEEMLRGEILHDSRTVSVAVNVLGAATGCYPSSVPRVRS